MNQKMKKKKQILKKKFTCLEMESKSEIRNTIDLYDDYFYCLPNGFEELCKKKLKKEIDDELN